MGDDRNGVLMVMFRVTLVWRLTIEAGKLMWPGNMRISLYVNPPFFLESMSSATERPSPRAYSERDEMASEADKT